MFDHYERSLINGNSLHMAGPAYAVKAAEKALANAEPEQVDAARLALRDARLALYRAKHGVYAKPKPEQIELMLRDAWECP